MTKEERNEILRTILSLLGAGALVVAAVAMPGIPTALAPFFERKTKFPQKKVLEALRYAKKRGWLEVAEAETGVEISLTKRGKERWHELRFDRPLRTEKWDGKWRIVIFDIPTKRKDARDVLRSILKRLGFLKAQESVWVTPYPCDEEIDYLRKFYVIRPYVRLILAERMEGEEILRQKFNL